jgi:hypothetical protein
MSRIVLHIDRLVLRGVHSSDPQALTLAVQAELALLMSQPGSAVVLANGSHRTRVRASEVRLPAKADVPSLGQAIAGGLHAGLRP